jgi:hypothetical protein
VWLTCHQSYIVRTHTHSHEDLSSKFIYEVKSRVSRVEINLETSWKSNFCQKKLDWKLLLCRSTQSPQKIYCEKNIFYKTLFLTEKLYESFPSLKWVCEDKFNVLSTHTRPKFLAMRAKHEGHLSGHCNGVPVLLLMKK